MAPAASLALLFCTTAVAAFQHRAPATAPILPCRHRSSSPTALIDPADLVTVTTTIAAAKAEAAASSDLGGVLSGLFDAADTASAKLSSGLDLGRALRSDNGGAIDALDRKVVDVFEDVTSLGVDQLSNNVLNAAESVETAVLDSIGHDILIFLACASAAAPIAQAFGITPILVYLIFGALLGPHGFDVFLSSQAGVELGDFGILFLLFSEGLEVSTDRLKQLSTFVPLGIAQISMTAGVLSFAILGPIAGLLERFIPLDAGLIDVTNPSEALVLALAGTLSTSAFVFPVLKEREWEERDAGKAATSILLLQDLFVAPLLVCLPFIVGQGVTDGAEIGLLTAKATLGFGLVLAIGSYLLRGVFTLVAEARSSDTFVALSLFVAVGMGTIAKACGLTDTAGAFAAGVLLANSNFRYEISASVLPFRGILLGVFFVDAGSNFDPGLLLMEGPTVATGVALLIVLKAFTLWLAGFLDAKFIPFTQTALAPAENLRLAVLLAGGGEFAFVVLAAAEKLGALPDELNALLTTIILLTMSLTPLLGEAAATLSQPLVALPPDGLLDSIKSDGAGGGGHARVAKDAIVVCGYGEVGSSTVKAILATALDAAEEVAGRVESGGESGGGESGESGGGSTRVVDDGRKQGAASIVCFDLNPQRLPRGATESDGVLVTFGDGANAELVRSIGVETPRAIIITYREASRCLSATQRLRASFPDARIYASASSVAEREALIAVGASAAILESQEVAVQLGACLFLDEETFQLRDASTQSTGPVPPLSVWETAVRALRASTSLDDERATAEEVARRYNL